ncbi:hypothetical protein F0Q45_25860, partial [Mycobacterium simiae]
MMIRDAVVSLARHTGLPAATIADLVAKGELRTLFNSAGRLAIRATPHTPLEARKQLRDRNRALLAALEK